MDDVHVYFVIFWDDQRPGHSRLLHFDVTPLLPRVAIPDLREDANELLPWKGC